MNDFPTQRIAVNLTMMCSWKYPKLLAESPVQCFDTIWQHIDNMCTLPSSGRLVFIHEIVADRMNEIMFLNSITIICHCFYFNTHTHTHTHTHIYIYI